MQQRARTPDRALTLGIVSAMYAYEDSGKVYTHLSLGRIIESLGSRFGETVVCVPVFVGAPPPSRDFALEADFVRLVPQPPYRTTVAGLRHPLGVLRSYWNLSRSADVIFIRGMVPYIGFLYALCVILRRSTCHWIVGNPEALLRSHRRRSALLDWLAIGFAFVDRLLSKTGRALTGGSFVCNGEELGRIYASSNTHVVVSTTINSEEIHVRDEPVRGEPARILYVGFIRPEKGLEFLLQAVSRLDRRTDWRLRIVGEANGFAGYMDRLHSLARELDIESRIAWSGYVAGGAELANVFFNADILVLPSLSEGTPRVLVEARANGVPVIASDVGGIPSSVKDGVDGVLVPAGNADAIASAIQSLLDDEERRQDLIRAGYRRVKDLTVDRFVDRIVGICGGAR